MTKGETAWVMFLALIVLLPLRLLELVCYVWPRRLLRFLVCVLWHPRIKGGKYSGKLPERWCPICRRVRLL